MQENLEIDVITNDIKIDSTSSQCKNIGEEKKWTKNCPKCKCIQIYSCRGTLTRAVKSNSICNDCNAKREFTEEQRRKQKISLTGRLLSPEHRENIRKSLLGKSFFKTRPYEWMLTKMRYNAKAQNRTNELTYEDFLQFSQIKSCHYCGDNITWNTYKSTLVKASQAYNIDRKDNDIGYTKENCVVCCSMCNHIKGNLLSYDEMLKIGKVITEIKHDRILTEPRWL